VKEEEGIADKSFLKNFTSVAIHEVEMNLFKNKMKL
jgi:hypothetical protein